MQNLNTEKLVKLNTSPKFSVWRILKNIKSKNRILHKKALSETISTILLIILGIALAIFFMMAYESMIPGGKLFSPGISCEKILKDEPIILKDACYNQLTKDIEVTIERDYSDLEIYSLEFSFLSQNEESSWICSSSCTNCKVLEEGELKKYYFKQEDPENQEEIAIKTGLCELKRSAIRKC